MYEEQLVPLVNASDAGWNEICHFWLQECGQRLGLEHREQESKAIACSKKKWSKEVLGKIASQEAREILKWQDDGEEGADEFEVLGGDEDEKEDKDRKHGDPGSGPGRDQGGNPKPKAEAKSPFGTIADRAKSLQEKSKKKSGYEPVDESESDLDEIAEQVSRGRTILRSMNEYQKEQIAEKWVQAAITGLPEMWLDTAQQGDKQAQERGEKKLQENLLVKILAAIESHQPVAQRGFGFPASDQELDRRLKEVDYPSDDVPLEIRLRAIPLISAPAAIPPRRMRSLPPGRAQR